MRGGHFVTQFHNQKHVWSPIQESNGRTCCDGEEAGLVARARLAGDLARVQRGLRRIAHEQPTPAR